MTTSPTRVAAAATAPAPAAPGTSPVQVLPRAVTERLLTESDAIARRMARRIAADIPLPPGYATTTYLRLVMRACREGLRALLRQLHDGRRPHPAELVALGMAGARQAEMGVPIEVMLRGYRVAARVVWQEVIDEAVHRGELSPPMVVDLTEQVLEYLDSLSGAVGHAYLETRERVLRQRDRERDHLLQRLLAGDASEQLRRLAAAAGLELAPPYRVLVVATPAPGADALLVESWRRHRTLACADEPGTWAALVDPAAAADALARSAAATLGGMPEIGVGPVASTLEEVGAAARRARAALAVGRRIRPDAAVHDHEEAGVYAVLAASPLDAHLYIERALGPLLLPGRRALLETLAVHVRTDGAATTAERLGVHRHTIAHRLRRIGELLGADLGDPDELHRLWLALTLRLVVGEGEGGPAAGGRATPGAAGRPRRAAPATSRSSPPARRGGRA